jgi:glycosidase
MEFHISRAAREHYQFDPALYQFTGNAVFADLQAVRVFAQRMNDLRDVAHNPHLAVRAGELNAMGLIDELSHLVVKLYDEDVRRQRGTEQRIFGRALDEASTALGADAVYQTLLRFTEEFPPVEVYRGQKTAAQYLATNSVNALEELLMLWLENANPAFAAYGELFDDSALADKTAYVRLIEALRAFFDRQPAFGPDNQTLVQMLRAPALAAPGSLEGQLTFMQQRWAPYFGETFSAFISQLLVSFDIIREDQKAALSFGWVGDGDPQSFVPSKDDLRTGNVMPGGQDITVVEYEAFTPDREWMPRLVLMAKTSYVWLDQLSRKYQREIKRFDQVPDEELDQLQAWGFTGLWLIGLWERSTASQRIKQMMGAQDAVASAYSLYDYVVAEDLGGQAAMDNLKARAWQRGIRVASDMVPNHMGIDSKWVLEKPDYFLSLPTPPYPSYTFNGPDLSRDERVGIFIEDHYYDHSDAAVVFKRVDKWTGEARYIYHGNDGTSIPWNDTAQLDYLNAEAREAVIQTILHVARQFPVVRFDAAMTLAKRHIRRLWFPEPGAGGAIPSRSGLGISAEQFEALMPNEFWREVVDRAAIEAPDTLLLAEAFWMLEGYFVRTLGMHRVYNSAFMNMLRDEKNDEYRQLIKNTIEFDPEILRRYVNFQNNPDEKTAVAQFGKDDKYFGVATLMSTMPGLPMFGHGQVEGYTEKYGMEFRYPKLWESPDLNLVARHERDIFPLLKKRYLFAGVDQFRLFDFWDANGGVNEDVFAYSNRYGDERSLVLYHNKFAGAKGWIRASAAYVVKHGDDKALTQTMLGEALGLHNDDAHFVIFHDLATGQEFIRSSSQLHEQGMYVELGAYKCHVFMDIREVVSDAEHPYAELNARLNGRGVGSIERELELLNLAPVTDAFRRAVNGEMLARLLAAAQAKAGVKATKERVTLLDDVHARMAELLAVIAQHNRVEADAPALAQAIRADIESAYGLTKKTAQTATGIGADDAVTWTTLFGWLLTRRLGEVVSPADGQALSKTWLNEWALGDALRDAFHDAGLNDDQAWQALMQIKLLSHRAILDGQAVSSPARGKQAVAAPPAKLDPLFDDSDGKALLRVNHLDGADYFDREAFESLLKSLVAAAASDKLADASLSAAKQTAAIKAARAAADQAISTAAAGGYRVDAFVDSAEGVADDVARPA